MKNKVLTFFNIVHDKNPGILLNSATTLQRTIGILGMTLPFILIIFHSFSVNEFIILESISHYFYTRVSSIFTSVLIVLGIFLIIYKGHEAEDTIVSTVAGLFAFFVVLSPTDNLAKSKILDFSVNELHFQYANTYLPVNKFRQVFHLISAGIFLSCLAYMSIFLFTKKDVEKVAVSAQKVKRNRIYKLSGYTMVISILIILLNFLLQKSTLNSNFVREFEHFYEKWKLTFVLETITVVCFGISWLIKGKTFFKDAE